MSMMRENHTVASAWANGDALAASNVLDDPRFFWESEPTLQPLYNALKGEAPAFGQLFIGSIG